VIVVVVITGDSGEDPASPAMAATQPAEARTRQEHANSGGAPCPRPSGTPSDTQ
jgi:hypothetical protein